MATLGPVSPNDAAQAEANHHSQRQHLSPPTSVKSLAETTKLSSIPSNFIFPTSPEDQAVSDPSIPVIDFSLLTSTDPDLRSRAVADLGKACQDWGVFLVINHGTPESLWNATIDACRRFFDLPEEEKRVYKGENVLDPIRFGTNVNASTGSLSFWRDYLSVVIHPEFHSPSKPEDFKDVVADYTTAMRKLVRELLRGISESLGLEPDYLDKILNMDSSLQRLVANYYPPCPQPELAMGIPAHTDPGLLTTLMQNGVGGLQVYQGGRWVKVDPPPNALMVNTADHLEIVTNGKYKSVKHRAVVNSSATRMSIVNTSGPALDTIVAPAPKLVNENNPAAYRGITYAEYVEFQKTKKLNEKTGLERLKI